MFVAAHIEAAPADRALIDAWRSEPAPLLPLLHAFHDRDGYISEIAIQAIGKELRIPLADLYATVTFYHHFSRHAPGQSAPRVCTGPICAQRGGHEILASLPSATPMACAGRCDDPVPVLLGHEIYVVKEPGQLERCSSSPLPPPNPGRAEECVFRHIRQPDRASLEGYRRTGGYEGLTQAVTEMKPNQVIKLMEESKLAGRGGAGFPTGVKWRAVAEAPNGPKTIVCNADEGEPGCFKDRALMDHDPFAVLEGMTIAAYATGATRGFLYLRYEYPETYHRLAAAITAAMEAGLLGDQILGQDFSFRVYLRRGAGAYICGEEGALLNSLEGKHPFPRNRPPYPVTHGYENLPTVVNNVETLASAAQILRKGADWYRGLGLGEHAGTKIISLSGDVQRPGNYEVPFGLPLKTLLHEWAGGPLPGRTIQAVTMAGISGGFLAGEALDSLTLDEASARSHGSMLGAAGMMAFDNSRNMVAIAHAGMTFFAHESCGKCFPCRIGTQRLCERLAGVAGPDEIELWTEEVHDLGRVMKAISACGLGMAAPLLTESLVKYFPAQVEQHVMGKGATNVRA
jgi:NADH-quinone oxidoreductase subunit F